MKFNSTNITLFGKDNITLNTPYSLVNFIIENQVTIQGINLDPLDVVTFEMFYLKSGTMPKECGCFITPGEMPEVTSSGDLYCDQCLDNCSGQKTKVRLTYSNPTVVLEAPQGVIIRAVYDGPGIGTSHIWVTTNTEVETLTPGMQGCPTKCCVQDPDSWRETGPRRCNVTTDDLEAIMVDNCGNEEWQVLRKLVWSFTGQRRGLHDYSLDSEDNPGTRQREEVTECGDIRWVDDGAQHWHDTGKDRPVAGSETDTVKEQINEFGFTRWVPGPAQEWYDTGEIRSATDADGNAIIEKKEVNQYGTPRWVKKEDAKWEDTGETRCEEHIIQEKRMDQAGTLRWFDTEEGCGYGDGANMAMPGGGHIFGPDDERDPEATAVLTACGSDEPVGYAYPTPRPGAKVPITVGCHYTPFGTIDNCGCSGGDVTVAGYAVGEPSDIKSDCE